jgi:predicted DNA-binding transcriptional regulator YafY
VTLECKEKLAGVVIDRFGNDVSLIECRGGFRVTVRVMISPNFFAWVLGFGKDMRIVSPSSVADELLSHLLEIKKVYEE